MIDDTADIIPDNELLAISVYPYDDDRYKFVLLGEDAKMVAYHLSERQLEHAFVVIGEALQPGLLVSLGFTLP